jgi:CheY-like chemotaxis protein
VITLDVMMPGMDGWSVLSALKADAALRRVPVVMMTIVDDRSLGFALGATDYLVKPVDREQLLDALRRACPEPAAARVLVVEDDRATREILTRTLEKEGWSVQEAENGRVALEHLAVSLPDVVLLDLAMPEMNGFELLDVVRADDRLRDVPVVVVTSMDLSEEERQRLRGGAERILRKGSHPREELVAEIRRLLTRASGGRTVEA